MNYVVERVARSICKRSGLDPSKIYEGETKPEWVKFVPHALDAMGAAMPTTLPMDAAGITHLRNSPSDASGCFEAMILAALEG
jgi:hypothetical protein